MNSNFNFWFLYVLVSMVAWIIIGNSRYTLVRNAEGAYVTHQRFKSGIEGVIVVLMSIMFGILVLVESWRGIAQFVIDISGPEVSGTAAELFAIVIIWMVLMPAYMAVGYTLMELAAQNAFSRIEKRRRTMRRRQPKRRDDLMERWSTDEFKIR